VLSQGENWVSILYKTNSEFSWHSKFLDTFRLVFGGRWAWIFTVLGDCSCVPKDLCKPRCAAYIDLCVYLCCVLLAYFSQWQLVLCETHDYSIVIVDNYSTIPVSPSSRYTAVYRSSIKYRETAQVSRVSLIPCSSYDHLAFNNVHTASR